MIEISNDPMERKLQKDLRDLNDLIVEQCLDIEFKVRDATPEMAEALAQTIRQRNNARVVLEHYKKTSA